MSPDPNSSLADATNNLSAGVIARQLLHHAWPVLVAQVLSISMMIADTLIASRYGTTDLAAVAIGRKPAAVTSVPVSIGNAVVS